MAKTEYRMSFSLTQQIIFIEELAWQYNEIFINADINDELSKTIIFPIHKKGNLYDPANNRDISLFH